jgi:hypothetical protein
MGAGDHTTLRQIELRDEAVRVLHRAITNALCGHEAAALASLSSPRAREWYEDVNEYAGLATVFSEKAAA